MPWFRKKDQPSAQDQKFDDPLHLVSLRLKTCEDALKRDPNDPDALFTKAVFLARIREYKRAVDCLRRVTTINPEYPMVWGLLSLVYSRMGDYQNAKLCREKSAEIEEAETSFSP